MKMVSMQRWRSATIWAMIGTACCWTVSGIFACFCASPCFSLIFFAGLRGCLCAGPVSSSHAWRSGFCCGLADLHTVPSDQIQDFLMLAGALQPELTPFTSWSLVPSLVQLISLGSDGLISAQMITFQSSHPPPPLGGGIELTNVIYAYSCRRLQCRLLSPNACHLFVVACSSCCRPVLSDHTVEVCR